MTFESFKNQYGLKLNRAQCEAVQATEGPVLLLAVPGSGKTTVLVSRLGYMVIGLGIPPSSILTMTYTVAATKDMKERFCNFFGEEWRNAVEFRTINGVCARIIRAYERKTGGTAFRLVSDEKETAALIAEIYKEVRMEFPTESDIKNVRSKITYVKNMMLSEEELHAYDKTAELPIEQIYRQYTEIMREQRAMDYDDQMVYAYRILRKYPQILSAVQNTY
ncbi:MAG: UvrD-helicase domain-containing protein, partial [Clostridia bacterium]|nr:UvrD-helicase domain-containing protein [Clostridia bacterium]